MPKGRNNSNRTVALNPKHALEANERAFCIKLSVMGGPGNVAYLREAYRRSHFPPTFREGRFVRADDVPDVEQLLEDARELWNTPGVKEYYASLSADTGAIAREVVHEQALLGDTKEQAKAAEQIFKLEDKLGFRDAAEEHLRLLVAIGTEVVVTVPGRGEVAFPLGEMFPKLEGCVPPSAAIEKTIVALQRYLKAEDADAEGAPAED